MDGDPHVVYRPPWLLRLVARLLIRGRDASWILRDLDASFAHDLDRGLGRGSAIRRYARNVLGSVWSVWTTGLRRLLTQGIGLDARLGVRMLAKQPLLTGVAMLALGLGIPASLSMHHVTWVLRSPLPVPEGERVMGIRHWERETSDPVLSSVHDLERWRASLGAFSSIGAARSYMLNVYAGEPGAPPVRGSEVTASTFDVLRGAPLLGRVFGPDDEVAGASDVVILGEDLWASRFARDPDIVGRTVWVGRREHTVVGVMPSDFRFPFGEDVWLPLRVRPADYPLAEGPGLLVYGRLADGVTSEEAGAEMALVTARQAADHPELYEQRVGEVVEMPILLIMEDAFSFTDPDLLIGQAIIAVLLLIVCGNVGILMLARTATRMSELSIRTALGASRARIVSQLFVEALVLTLLATGLGLLLAEGVARALMRPLRTIEILPYWMDLGLDKGIVLTALGLAAFCAVLAGVTPALKVTGRHVQANLQRLAASTSSVRFGLASTLLIVAEVVASVGFLAMGGVLVGSMFQDREGRLGFEPEEYYQGTLRLPREAAAGTSGDPDEDDAVRPDRTSGEIADEVLRRLLAHGDVRGAGVGVDILGAMTGGEYIALEGEDEWAQVRGVRETIVDVGYFSGLNRPILTGRDFAEADLEAEPDPYGRRSPVIVNTSFVERVLGGRSPVGRRFWPYASGQVDPDDRTWFEIVGVVGPFGMNPRNPGRDAGFYRIAPIDELRPTRFLVHVEGDAAGFGARFREIVASVDPEATLETAMPVSEVMATESNLYRLVAVLQFGLAGIAFLLSVSGLYALMSFTVSQRTREIGIRTALGARPSSIVSTIGRRAALQLGTGVVVGGGLAWFLLDEITSEASVVNVNVPLTVAITMVAALLVGAAACASPTLRGLRIQPGEALRES
jgi:putative ABC transport system permease protein